MRVTGIEAVTQGRQKIFLDDQFAFVLYKGELSRFNLKEGKELSEEEYHNIRAAVLRRAKIRAMHLLETMGRTEAQLKEKLQNGDYPADIVEEAISYVKSFGYINDEEYVRSFVASRKGKKSRKELYALLGQKGVDMEMVSNVLAEVYDAESEEETIRQLILKKCKDPGQLDEKGRQKLYAYLMRKGFRYEQVSHILRDTYY